MEIQPVDLSFTQGVIDRFRGQKGAIIPLLQEIQEIYGYVPREAIDLVSQEMEIYPVQIYGILTFYTQFRLTPRGEHTLKVCLGTACHVMGGKNIFDYISTEMKVKAGDTTQDGKFTLERVACVGCCGMAPVLVVDDQTFGNCTIQSIEELLKEY
ncbi:MAG: NADH-quinone oxidoreductase subunit NuoE [Thermodesulfobacteriota bacterium]|nr:NADH-quinone oxidoreductase subunit NuoE [Thermodesulfobacteriota bacterium]